MNSESQALNPRDPDPRPSAVFAEPSTLSPQPTALSPQPSTRNHPQVESITDYKMLAEVATEEAKSYVTDKQIEAARNTIKIAR